MKKVILVVGLLISTAAVVEQKSFFENISETDQYHQFDDVTELENKKGFFKAKEQVRAVKLKKGYLPTGEGYKISYVVDYGKSKGDEKLIADASFEKYNCEGYPYESILTEGDNNGYISIDDYVIKITGISEDKTSFKYISRLYLKVGESAVGDEGKKEKKKKSSFFSKLKALKNVSTGGFGPEHKEFESKNIRKLITDYLVAMKAKQDARTPKEKQADKNILKAKEQKVLAKENEWAEAKRYNDSVRNTPEHQNLQRRMRQNEINANSAKMKNTVTLRNTGNRIIYIGTSLSRNRGTKISAGSTGSWNCSQDAYIQTSTTSGGSTSYKSSGRLVYRANSGCGSTVSIN